MSRGENRRQVALELVAAGARLAEAGLVLPGEGNLSSRVGDTILITPTGADKGRLSAAELVNVALDGSPVPRRASMEVGVHLAIYERFAGVAAVVHAHPPAIQALSELDLEPRCGLLVEGRDLLGSVVTVAYHPPGSVALARGVVAGLESCSACVLAQHGALTVGATTLEALRRMLLLERLAVITAEVDAR